MKALENSLENNHQRGQGRLSRAASSLVQLLKSLDSVTPPLGSQGQKQRKEGSSSSPADLTVSGASVNSLHPFNILQTGHWKRECLPAVFAGLVRHCVPRKELISSENLARASHCIQFYLPALSLSQASSGASTEPGLES